MAEEHPDAVPLTAEEHPDAVPLTAEEGPADAAPRMVEQHAVDAAIITNPLQDNDLLEKILISLPGAAFLARAVPVSDRWCRIISGESFLKRFRVSHPSSPPIGVFVDNKNERVPRFHTGIATSNPVIASAVRHTDICLTRLDDGLRWRLRDCRNGQLLLSGAGGLLCIYDPLSERRVPIGPRTHLDHDGKCLGDCLLDGLARHMVSVEQRGQQIQAEESFRVLSLQQQSRSSSNVRAVVYDSGTLEWSVHPQTGWAKVQLTKLQLKAMYAAGHIFWQTDVARLLVLDTSTMEFSEHGVPWETVSTSWAIGELRDGKGCLVCLQGLNSSFGKDGFIVEEPLRLEVWALKEEEEDKQAKICWKWEKDVRVSEILPEDARVYKVHKVINGLALIGCTKGSYAIDLQSMTLLAKFESGGDVYPYQMSWPPAVLAAATTVVSRHLGANLSNEESSQIPSNNMDGREGASSGGSESASLQSQLQVESPDDSGSSGIEDASCDDDNQRALASLGIGDAAHTDATTAVAFNAVNSHANEEQTGGCTSGGRTMLTTTHEKVAQDIASVSPEGKECESGSRKKSDESGMHLEESCNPGFKLNGDHHEAGNLYKYQDDTVLQSESARFPEVETKGSTSCVETLLDNMLNSKDKDRSHLIKGKQIKHVSTEVHSSQTPLNSEQHGIGEKSSQDLHGGSARIQPMETDPCHDELTLQTAGVFPFESCDGAILEDKSETVNLPKNTTEDTEMLEQQNSDKAHIEVSCADKMSEGLYDDNNTLEKNTIFGGKVTVECHLALLHNKNSEARSNAISSPMQKRPFACQCHVDGCTMSYDSENNLAKHFREVHEQKKHFARRFTGCSEEFSSKNKRKIHEGSSAHVELSTNRINCVSTSPAGGPEAQEEPRPAQVVARRTSNRPRKPNKLVSGDDWVV